MEDIRKQQESLKDSGIGRLINSLKKADESLYDKIMPEYKEMVAKCNILYRLFADFDTRAHFRWRVVQRCAFIV